MADARFTTEIPPELHTRLKELALKKGVKMKVLVKHLLNLGLESPRATEGLGIPTVQGQTIEEQDAIVEKMLAKLAQEKLQ